MVRLTSLSLRLGWPASCSSRLASARDFSMSRPEARHLLELALGQRPLRARPEGPAHVLDQRHLAHRLRSAPPVDGEREGTAHAHVVERLALDVEGQEDVGHPRALLHRDLVLHGLEQLVALLRRAAAELRVVLAAAQAAHHRVAAHEQRLVAVEVGAVLAEVLVEAHRAPVRALDVLDELEGARPHDLGLGISRVLLELLGAVDAVEGRGEVQQHRHVHLAGA